MLHKHVGEAGFLSRKHMGMLGKSAAKCRHGLEMCQQDKEQPSYYPYQIESGSVATKSRVLLGAIMTQSSRSCSATGLKDVPKQIGREETTCPLYQFPSRARYDDGICHPTTLQAGEKAGGKRAGLRQNWADVSDDKPSNTDSDEQARVLDSQMGQDPIPRT